MTCRSNFIYKFYRSDDKKHLMVVSHCYPGSDDALIAICFWCGKEEAVTTEYLEERELYLGNPDCPDCEGTGLVDLHWLGKTVKRPCGLCSPPTMYERRRDNEN